MKPDDFQEPWRLLPATTRQLEHLREDLFYEGPSPLNRGNASDLIEQLQNDPKVFLRRTYDERISVGVTWPVRPAGYPIPKKEYDEMMISEWWEETRRMAVELGVDPPERRH